LNSKRTALAVAVEREKGEKQFCAFSARARFHTGWPERTSGLEIGFSQILAGHSFANEQPAKAKKPRKVAAGQEMLLPISGKANDQTSSQEGQQASSGTKPKMGITNWGRSDRSSTRSIFRFTVAK